jgi:hypothetical protein
MLTENRRHATRIVTVPTARFGVHPAMTVTVARYVPARA